MGNDCYVYCKAHRETLEADKWFMVAAPQEFLRAGVILGKWGYARRVREMELGFREDSFARERHWIEREFAMLDAFLSRHEACELRAAATYGPEELLEDYFGHYRTGDRYFDFGNDRGWSVRKPGDRIQPYHRDVVEEIRAAPPL